MQHKCREYHWPDDWWAGMKNPKQSWKIKSIN
jgi:hypothetical protein